MKISCCDWKMNRVVPGSSVHAPIVVDSRENSYASDDESTVTFQSVGSGAYEFEVTQGEVESPFSLSDIYQPFEPSRMVFFGENERIRPIRVPFAVEPTRTDNGQRIPPQPLTNMHELANNVPNEALGLQSQGLYVNSPRQAHPPANQLEVMNNVTNEAQGVQAQGFNVGSPNEALGVEDEDPDVSLPMKGSGLRRSSRKRNEAIYNEDLLANRLPRLTRWRGESSQKKKPTHCLRIRASNHYPALPNSDDEGYESDD
ncbi:OLC1v1007162C1 [Oldenlandia corymbosa var. corymbosa]|uniref:OLC1v1007162C1 n=1 Tax=Oldenlandia corymbosa var. corymbosa TaxID=529605 RepID=A0AAV1DLE6_OLDCO|nr:OLC1v1007162C1 [Oldenlandia corymbosa var. corymbosa]